jgi:hypothetical protein
MNWLRWSDSPNPVDEAALERVEPIARALVAAAREAPPSPRGGAIRTALLDGLAEGAPRPAAGGWFGVALAAAVLALVVLLGVGAASIGSLISDLLERAPADPSPPALPMETPIADDRANEPELVPYTRPTPDETATDPQSAPPDAPAQPAVQPTPAQAAEPPGGGPDALPTPPVPGPPGPLPTPPLTGPPGWAPAP